VPITNPRNTYQDALFTIQSFDAKGNQIDRSPEPSDFYIRMREIGVFNYMTVDADSKINGERTTYTMTFAPNVPVEKNDKMVVKFPEQIGLPEGLINCQGEKRFINIMRCYKRTDNTLEIQFNDVESMRAGDPFWVTVDDVRNPYSTAPTDPFDEVIMKNYASREISKYEGPDVFVKMETVSEILVANLFQSTKEPAERAEYTLTFETNNPIPSDAAIEVHAPPGVSIKRDSSACSVTTNSLRTDVCRI
jgi:hypothetical protein